jgi:hypothetical protein
MRSRKYEKKEQKIMRGRKSYVYLKKRVRKNEKIRKSRRKKE